MDAEEFLVARIHASQPSTAKGMPVPGSASSGRSW
jgi:hypothetical protein